MQLTLEKAFLFAFMAYMGLFQRASASVFATSLQKIGSYSKKIVAQHRAKRQIDEDSFDFGTCSPLSLYPCFRGFEDENFEVLNENSREDLAVMCGVVRELGGCVRPVLRNCESQSLSEFMGHIDGAEYLCDHIDVWFGKEACLSDDPFEGCDGLPGEYCDTVEDMIACVDQSLERSCDDAQMRNLIHNYAVLVQEPVVEAENCDDVQLQEHSLSTADTSTYSHGLMLGSVCAWIILTKINFTV